MKKDKTIIGILNTKILMGIIIYIFLSLTSVLASNVIVKEGAMTIEDNLNATGILYTDSTSNRLGIGITNPAVKFQVSDNNATSTSVYFTNYANSSGFTSGTPATLLVDYFGNTLAAGINMITFSTWHRGAGYAGSNNIAIQARSDGSGNGTRFGILSEGLNGENNFGGYMYGQGNNATGTNSTGLYAVAVNGSYVYGIYATASGGTKNYAGYFDNGNVYVKNNLGIGTLTPNAKLQVQQTGSSGTIYGINVSSVNTGGNSYGIYVLSNSTGTGITGYGARFDNIGYSSIIGSVGYGVFANSTTTGSGGATNYGVYGTASGTSTQYGLYGSATGSGITSYGIYATASGGQVANWAGYFDNGNVWVVNNLSAQNVIDRSRWCDMTGANAISALSSITNDGANINKTSMPDCAVTNLVVGINQTTNETIYEKGRDIGAYISYLTIVNQEQQRQIDLLKSELCSKDNTYSFCA